MLTEACIFPLLLGEVAPVLVLCTFPFVKQGVQHDRSGRESGI